MRRANEEGVTVEGKHYTMYEATQRQRSLERSMRKQKRRILIDETAGDKEKLQWDQIRLVRTREEYHRFSEAAGLREQWERAEAAGFTRKHGKAATKTSKMTIAKPRKSDILKSGETTTSQDGVISRRNSAKGKPAAIVHFDTQLSNRQQMALDRLPDYDSRIIVKKRDISMTDLAAMTAKTGDEFALFTKGGERLVIRGNRNGVNVGIEAAMELAKEGYVWSGHTHPGVGRNCLLASEGDILVLRCFSQSRSVIYNSLGEYLEFGEG